jgi:biotin transport system substrate-specific component
VRSRNQNLFLIALFAAFTCAAGFIRFPLFPVPFTLQTLFVYLSGGLLGKKSGALSQVLFLILGLIGLPVFATGGGLGYVLQPTFGYLLSFPAAAWIVGRFCEKAGPSAKWHELFIFQVPSLLLILGMGTLYLFFYLKWISGKTVSLISVALSGGAVFLPAETVKVLLSTALLMKLRRLTPLTMIMLCCILLGADRGWTQQRTGLARIKEDIKRLETEINSKEARETSLLEQLEDLDRKIGLQQRLMQEFRLEEQEKERAVSDAKNRLASAEQSYAQQRDLVGRRMVSIYKRGRTAEWEALAYMKSLNQALVWIKYQKIILQNDGRNLRLLQQKKTDVTQQKSSLEKELSDKQRVIEEVHSETVRLEANKGERKRLLAIVRKEKEPLLEQLQQKRIAYREIESWIVREEERRKTEEEKRRKLSNATKTTEPVQTKELNDKFIWPVHGRIVSRYGRHMDPQLKTWTENLGVEIQAKDRDMVRAVSGGQVKRVDWLRGMGNLVFLDHGGFYTIYGHLENVFVNLGENVFEGKEIGQVGDQNSFYGSNLHFEIWKGKTVYDPEQWLK